MKVFERANSSSISDHSISLRVPLSVTERIRKGKEKQHTIQINFSSLSSTFRSSVVSETTMGRLRYVLWPEKGSVFPPRDLSLSQIAYAPYTLKMLQALWFVLAILLMQPPPKLNRGNSAPLWTSVTSSLGFINFPKLVLQPLAEADSLGATFIISWYDCLEEASASNWSSNHSNSASNSASTSSIPSTGSCLDSHPLDWFDCMSMLFWQKRAFYGIVPKGDCRSSRLPLYQWKKRQHIPSTQMVHEKNLSSVLFLSRSVEELPILSTNPPFCGVHSYSQRYKRLPANSRLNIFSFPLLSWIEDHASNNHSQSFI